MVIILIWSHIANVAVVPYTSNMHQNETETSLPMEGSYSGQSLTGEKAEGRGTAQVQGLLESCLGVEGSL